jgi:hypothetical protein
MTREDRRRINSCLNKEVRYASLEEARRKGEALEREKNRIGLDAYKCEFCPGYHLGHVQYTSKRLARFPRFAEGILRIAAQLHTDDKGDAYKTLIHALNEARRRTLSFAVAQEDEEARKRDIRNIGKVSQQAERVLRRLFSIGPATRREKIRQWKLAVSSSIE